MKSQYVLKIAALFGCLAVIIGAFGAHGLEVILVKNSRLETFDTAVQYHFYHTLALLLTSFLIANNTNRYLIKAAYFFTVGIVLFSGSLYVLALTNFTLLGAVTPFGGLCFIAGWLCLFCAAKE